MRFNSNNYHSFNESVKSVQNEDLQTPERVKEIRDKDDKLTKGYKRFHGVVIIPNDKKRAEVTQKRKENFDLDRKERNSKQLYGKGGKVVKQSVKEDVEQVDELSKPLLKRYVKAATSNVISRQWKGDPADGQSRTQRSVKIGRAADKIRGVSRPKVKVFDEETEQVDEAGHSQDTKAKYSS